MPVLNTPFFKRLRTPRGGVFVAVSCSHVVGLKQPHDLIRGAFRIKRRGNLAQSIDYDQIAFHVTDCGGHAVIAAARALHDEGVENVLITIVKNLRTLEPESFWFVLDNHGWMHSYDDEGRLRPYKDLPMTVAELIDDPFRSLAGELRRHARQASTTAIDLDPGPALAGVRCGDEFDVAAQRAAYVEFRCDRSCHSPVARARHVRRWRTYSRLAGLPSRVHHGALRPRDSLDRGIGFNYAAGCDRPGRSGNDVLVERQRSAGAGALDDRGDIGVA